MIGPLDSDILLSCQDLAIGRSGRVLLRAIDWEIRRGQWWWLTGPNGGGKTTLLMTLLGELPILGGRLVRHPWVADGGSLAVVPQHDDLLPTLPLTVGEYLALGQIGTGSPQPQAIIDAAAAMDLPLRRSYWQLSGGQRQRARIARALARRPALLVLDEPFNHLDHASVDRACAGLRERHARDLAVVVVGHRLPELADVGTGSARIIADRLEIAP